MPDIIAATLKRIDDSYQVLLAINLGSSEELMRSIQRKSLYSAIGINFKWEETARTFLLYHG